MLKATKKENNLLLVEKDKLSEEINGLKKMEEKVIMTIAAQYSKIVRKWNQNY